MSLDQCIKKEIEKSISIDKLNTHHPLYECKYNCTGYNIICANYRNANGIRLNSTNIINNGGVNYKI